MAEGAKRCNLLGGQAFYTALPVTHLSSTGTPVQVALLKRPIKVVIVSTVLRVHSSILVFVK